MSLPPGTRLGSYEIAGLLGAGGMGEVYRATDTRLDREVAIKVLPAAFAADTDRLARFEREAKLLASLNHTNIAHVYGFESATLDDGASVHFLAMELVEGEDLAERLKRGAIPVDEALAVAKQIAEALEEAHEKGIVHRDLKPANVKVAPDGKVKVLDFGLAKAMSVDPMSASGAHDLSQSPTLAGAGTMAGTILGTAAYMSPEQARGRPIDKRADIWSFGVVLYEMLVGRPLFAGETASDVLAGVLKTEIDLSTVPAATPAALRQTLRRCLERSPKNRLHDIADARLAIDEVLEGRSEPGATVATRGARVGRSRRAMGIAAVAVLCAGAWLAGRAGRAPGAPVFLDLSPPEGQHFRFQGDFGAAAVLSPDGTRIVFGAEEPGASDRTLWVRSLASGETTRVATTRRATWPFFSPDGQSLGYFLDGKLVTAPIAGGAATTVAPAPNGRGGAWAPDGTIVFSPDYRSPLFRVPASGGRPAPLTTLETRRHTTHRWPSLTPDGRAVVYLATNHLSDRALAQSELRFVRLDGGEDHALVPSFANGVVAGGQLLYLRERSLLAQEIDAAGRLSGSPAPVVSGPLYDFSIWRSTFAAVADRLVFAPGAETKGSHVSRVDRSGKLLEELTTDDAYYELRLSPDGRTVAISRGKPSDIWLLDLERRTQSRLTFEPLEESSPVWSPDGRWVYYSQQTAGKPLVARKAANGSGSAEVVYTSPDENLVFPTDITADGRFLLVETGVFPFIAEGDVQWLALDGSRRLVPLLAAPASESLGRLSPDGRWVVYASLETGMAQIYVVPAEVGGRRDATQAAAGKWQVSVDGGAQPIWSRDGRELMYLDPTSNLMRVEVLPEGAAGLRFGAPQRMFGTTLMATQVCFDVTPDGRSLILNHFGPAQSRPLRVIENWRRLPR